MIIELVLIGINIIATAVSIYLMVQMKTSLNNLSKSISLTLDKYILVVRSLGVAEGNVQGTAEQVAKQEKIDKGLQKESGSNDIVGVIKGTIKKQKNKA